MPAMQVDPRFARMGRLARRRRRRLALLRAGLALALLLSVAAWGWWSLAPDLRVNGLFGRGQEDMAQGLVQVEAEFDIAPVLRADSFGDLPGDPLIIAAPDHDDAQDARHLPAPDLPGRITGSQVTLLDSPLLAEDRQMVPMLPSTREEFALFQAERSQMGATMAVQAGPVADGSSSMAFLRESGQRPPLWREMILEVTGSTDLAGLLTRNGFGSDQARRLAERIAEQMGIDPALQSGAVLALRYRLRGDMREVVQLSLYDPQGFVGALALGPAGQLVAAADAWVDQPLLQQLLARHPAPDTGQDRQRLLDLIYAAALRNDVAPEVIGQALALMSRVHDLDSFASPGDRLQLIHDGGGEVLFLGVVGPGGDRSCYVVPEGEGRACHAPQARLQARGPALARPVGGVLTQRFVPPVGEDRDGQGHVAWSAPEGSPVLAAASGRITAQRQTGLGALIELTHDDGMVSRYDGLASLPDEGPGAHVAAGSVIGHVGPVRGSARGQAAPGLRFQLLSDGAAIDPIPLLGVAVLASDAIEALIEQIITVESAGDARARNPLSTATGLGQFIESTWLRMIGTYRPDMMQALSRSDLLQLRFDPDLSRQMVRHLAQENEAFLRARGHAITPGRLYLAHFLGPAGADRALRADPAAPVGQVMGAQVVAANPFLRGYDIARLRDWADRKMAGGASGRPLPQAAPVSPQIREFVAAMDRLRLAQGG